MRRTRGDTAAGDRGQSGSDMGRGGSEDEVGWCEVVKDWARGERDDSHSASRQLGNRLN